MCSNRMDTVAQQSSLCTCTQYAAPVNTRIRLQTIAHTRAQVYQTRNTANCVGSLFHTWSLEKLTDADR